MKFEDCGAENPSYDDLNLEHRGAVKVPFFCFGAVIHATADLSIRIPAAVKWLNLVTGHPLSCEGATLDIGLLIFM